MELREAIPEGFEHPRVVSELPVAALRVELDVLLVPPVEHDIELRVQTVGVVHHLGELLAREKPHHGRVDEPAAGIARVQQRGEGLAVRAQAHPERRRAAEHDGPRAGALGNAAAKPVVVDGEAARPLRGKVPIQREGIEHQLEAALALRELAAPLIHDGQFVLGGGEGPGGGRTVRDEPAMDDVGGDGAQRDGEDEERQPEERQGSSRRGP